MTEDKKIASYYCGVREGTAQNHRGRDLIQCQTAAVLRCEALSYAHPVPETIALM